MLQSMTGFGKAEKEIANKRIAIEFRSLNSKSLDLNLRMPYDYKSKEHELRREIGKKLTRGKVDVSFHIESTKEETPASINVDLAKKYHSDLKKLAKALKEPADESLLSMVLKMPEVLTSKRERVEVTNAEWKQVMVLVSKAMQAFQKFRSDEGKVLAKDFQLRIKTIEKLLKEIIKTDPTRIAKIRKRIQGNINELVEKSKVDKNRFEQELIFYIEKLDITEEKVRLQTHLDYFIATMKEDANGRKLGFIAQEIGREINTIGSKANDAKIQKMVVQMKDELEKIKEQLLNVL